MEECEKADPYTSDDPFLYSRCVALRNGSAYDKEVKNGEKRFVEYGSNKKCGNNLVFRWIVKPCLLMFATFLYSDYSYGAAPGKKKYRY